MAHMGRVLVRAIFLLAIFTMASGCVSGPREYDGVIGYKAINEDGRTRIVYVDEARVGREKTLAKIADVCASRERMKSDLVEVQVISETESVEEVSFNVPVAVGTTSTGETRGSGASVATVSTMATQNHAMSREMKIRRIEALCPRNAP